LAKNLKQTPHHHIQDYKPETSSESPSTKSKGVRVVSAKQEIYQISDKEREKKINHK